MAFPLLPLELGKLVYFSPALLVPLKAAAATKNRPITALRRTSFHTSIRAENSGHDGRSESANQSRLVTPSFTAQTSNSI
ncbi:hypothetical protein Y032_0031g2314 [Ancylostoma ceylanicum]|uniref:Uncharacterized protein n=1 Tax=Ancylostoma ceylanicum TaxID=53326 RepID=A0A016UQR8_9BILA|nr:hypothetical protein Y032_0031g2314 [Ancylostoma ceylanicum]